MGINIVQKRREKERLERELEEKRAQKRQLSRKLECAEELLQKNKRALTNIEYFQREKQQTLQRFEPVNIGQRSIQTMYLALQGRMSGQPVRTLYGSVEAKRNSLSGEISSITEGIDRLNREIRRIEAKIEQIEREIRLQSRW